MTQKQDIAQLDRPAPVVLGQSVLIKLRESRGQSLLHLSRERNPPVLPVDGHKLGQLVGALDHALQRLRHHRTMRLVTRHLPHQQQRRVTQLHLLARFHRTRRHLLSSNLRYQLRDAASDLNAVLVELRFPKHARQNRAPQLKLSGDVAGRRAFMRTRPEV